MLEFLKICISKDKHKVFYGMLGITAHNSQDITCHPLRNPDDSTQNTQPVAYFRYRSSHPYPSTLTRFATVKHFQPFASKSQNFSKDGTSGFASPFGSQSEPSP